MNPSAGTSAVIRICEACGQKNRVPAAKLASEGRCGACKAAIPALSEPLDVGPQEFDEIVGSVAVPILVDFWAEWCGWSWREITSRRWLS